MMAKYFEVINEDSGSVVIDDMFKNVELVGTYPLSSFTKNFPDHPRVDYSFPIENRESIIYGIGLRELAGKEFCISIVRKTWDNKVHIAFHEPQPNGYLNVIRDDIIQIGKLYAFEYKNRIPSPHLCGVEIYNDTGRVVYTSDTKYLQVINCATGVENAETPISGESVAIVLGSDYFADILEHSVGARGVISEWHPIFTVKKDSVRVKRQGLNLFYMGKVKPNDGNAVRSVGIGYAYGWMIGRVM